MEHNNLHLLDHPLVQHKMAFLRDKNTGVKEFRTLIGEVSTLLCLEATWDLPLRPAQVETPIGKADVQMMAGRKLAIVPILRAGLGMVDGILQLVPAAKTGHIGLERDHDTLKPREYYCKLPSDISQRDVLLLDPMLATGGSASAAIQLLKEKGVRRLSFVCVVAAPEGVERITREHPEIPIYCAALDQGLNENGYIVPGLGDAGDRIFGTE